MPSYEKRNYAAVLPDGSEHGFEMEIDGRGGGTEFGIRQKLLNIVTQAGLRASRAAPQTVKIKVFGLYIKGTQIDRREIGNYDIQPPFTSMTEAEFTAAQTAKLGWLPKEFRGCVSGYAWEHGHANGWEEVLGLVDELVDTLKEPIRQYRQTVVDQVKKGTQEE